MIMLDLWKDLLIVFGRIVTIIPLLLFVVLFMGKRAIGQLPVFDFIIVLILGSLVGADIADPDIHHMPTVFAIIAIGIFQRIIANWKLANRKVDRTLTFEPTVVIQNGKLIHENLKKIRYSIDNILEMLREKDTFDISEVETAIVEASGALSVLKKPQKNSVTREDMNMMNSTSSISFPVILEGTIYSDVLKKVNADEAWLMQELSNQGTKDLNDVFFASINQQQDLHITFKNEHDLTILPIRH